MSFDNHRKFAEANTINILKLHTTLERALELILK